MRRRCSGCGNGSGRSRTALNTGEHRRGRADAERQRDDGDGREARGVAQRTDAVADVAPEVREADDPTRARPPSGPANATSSGSGPLRGGECIGQNVAGQLVAHDAERRRLRSGPREPQVRVAILEVLARVPPRYPDSRRRLRCSGARRAWTASRHSGMAGFRDLADGADELRPALALGLYGSVRTSGRECCSTGRRRWPALLHPTAADPAASSMR